MRNTKFLKLYSTNKTHCLPESFLRDDYGWNVKQLILQLKLGISHITHKGKVARLNKLEHFYGYVTNSLCPLCGKEDEDTYHILFKCSHYIIERQKYIVKLSNYNHRWAHRPPASGGRRPVEAGGRSPGGRKSGRRPEARRPEIRSEAGGPEAGLRLGLRLL